MDDSYLSISFKVYPNSGIEILIAELSLLEFELFEEKPYGLIAYIKSSEYSQNIFEKVKILNSKEFEVEFEVKKVENKNWNEEWETYEQEERYFGSRPYAETKYAFRVQELLSKAEQLCNISKASLRQSLRQCAAATLSAWWTRVDYGTPAAALCFSRSSPSRAATPLQCVRRHGTSLSPRPCRIFGEIEKNWKE